MLWLATDLLDQIKVLRHPDTPECDVGVVGGALPSQMAGAVGEGIIASPACSETRASLPLDAISTSIR
jgi:hypothetical protein